MPPLRHIPRISAAEVQLPAHLRAPAGWRLLELAPGRAVRLDWSLELASAGNDRGGWLRVTTGIDDREQKIVSVRLVGSGRELGALDLRFAHAIESFQLHFEAHDWADAIREGVTLTLTEPAASPLWLLGGGGTPEALAPHLLTGDATADRTAAFFDYLGSLASVQPFGWMHGCVLDALHDLHEAGENPRWQAARDEHLAFYFKADGRLVYEDPGSKPTDDALHCIEETLPFGVLAKVSAAHPLHELALGYWARLTREDGSVEAADRLVSTEGTYTIAYPMAVIARVRGDHSLAELAARQLCIRRELLRREDGLWLRYWRKTGELHFRSWARGVAWYLLGLERTLGELRGLVEIADLEDELRSAAAWAASLQRADGLWGCFVDDATTSVDTSGSAGIAAALARGARSGVLSADFTRAAEAAWRGLQPHLCVDGVLAGAAQSNRGGEALQRGDYRVLSAVGGGLMGQLTAALRVPGV